MIFKMKGTTGMLLLSLFVCVFAAPREESRLTALQKGLIENYGEHGNGDGRQVKYEWWRDLHDDRSPNPDPKSSEKDQSEDERYGEEREILKSHVSKKDLHTLAKRSQYRQRVEQSERKKSEKDDSSDSSESSYESRPNSDSSSSESSRSSRRHHSRERSKDKPRNRARWENDFNSDDSDDSSENWRHPKEDSRSKERSKESKEDRSKESKEDRSKESKEDRSDSRPDHWRRYDEVLHELKQKNTEYKSADAAEYYEAGRRYEHGNRHRHGKRGSGEDNSKGRNSKGKWLHYVKVVRDGYNYSGVNEAKHISIVKSESQDGENSKVRIEIKKGFNQDEQHTSHKSLAIAEEHKYVKSGKGSKNKNPEGCVEIETYSAIGNGEVNQSNGVSTANTEGTGTSDQSSHGQAVGDITTILNVAVPSPAESSAGENSESPKSSNVGNSLLEEVMNLEGLISKLDETEKAAEQISDAVPSELPAKNQDISAVKESADTPAEKDPNSENGEGASTFGAENNKGDTNAKPQGTILENGDNKIANGVDVPAKADNAESNEGKRIIENVSNLRSNSDKPESPIKPDDRPNVSINNVINNDHSIANTVVQTNDNNTQITINLHNSLKESDSVGSIIQPDGSFLEIETNVANDALSTVISSKVSSGNKGLPTITVAESNNRGEDANVIESETVSLSADTTVNQVKVPSAETTEFVVKADGNLEDVGVDSVADATSKNDIGITSEDKIRASETADLSEAPVDVTPASTQESTKNLQETQSNAEKDSTSTDEASKGSNTATSDAVVDVEESGQTTSDGATDVPVPAVEGVAENLKGSEDDGSNNLSTNEYTGVASIPTSIPSDSSASNGEDLSSNDALATIISAQAPAGPENGAEAPSSDNIVLDTAAESEITVNPTNGPSSPTPTNIDAETNNLPIREDIPPQKSNDDASEQNNEIVDNANNDSTKPKNNTETDPAKGPGEDLSLDDAALQQVSLPESISPSSAQINDSGSADSEIGSEGEETTNPDDGVQTVAATATENSVEESSRKVEVSEENDAAVTADGRVSLEVSDNNRPTEGNVNQEIPSSGEKIPRLSVEPNSPPPDLL